MAKAGELQVKVLLFPLKFHKGAKEECISIICDKKGLEGLKSRYRSKNQCEEGKKLINDTVRFLQSKGITGTPTYIFSDGRFQSGVLSKDKLHKRLGAIQKTEGPKPASVKNFK
jgi:thiol:disulfide interchange protein DsbC